MRSKDFNVTIPVTTTASSDITVSAIIPTFNRADLLAETLQAVLSQTRAADEILVVDDGSDDHTRSVAASFGSDLTLISKTNSGKADSLNVAMAASTGSHVWIVDDDDIPRASGLEILTKLIAANAGSQISYGRHVRFSQETPGGQKTYQETGYWDTRGPEYFLIATLEDFFVHQPAMLVARELYKQAGPFDTAMVASEDYDMLIRLGLHGKAVATDEVIFEQRVHSGVRGQKGHQFAATDRNAKWIEYDQRIFRAAYDKLPLDAYLPRGVSASESAAGERQALIQRASVMARKKLWPLALDDLHRVSMGILQVALTDTERVILRRALLSKYGCDELFDTSDILADLRRLGASSPLGRALVAGVGRSLVWHFRTELARGRIGRASKILQTYRKLR